MKETKSMRLKHSIQKKLMAATAMLMVAVIMMVSSTYAWFTLSTAPEVTGITTAVGANGNLEIALATKDTWANPDNISSAVGTTGDNTAWGNLVDVSDTNKYGLDEITLMPAELNVNSGGTVVGSYLKTPVYGSDGRISALTANTNTGTIASETSNKFTINDNYGVRAIGTSTQMTPRQSDYRNAKASLTSAGSMTKTYASRSLYSNGSKLADLIVKHALAEKNSDTYTQAELAVIEKVIADLQLSLEQAEEALNNGLKGIVASQASASAIDDTIYESIKGSINLDAVTVSASEGTVSGTITVNGSSVALSPSLANAIYVYERADGNLSTASTKAAELKTANSDTMSWADIKAVLEPLVNPDYVTINDISSDQIRDNVNELVNSVLQGGIEVQLPSGSGVYSDVAELAGNYKTSIVIANLSYGTISASNVPATMITTVNVGPYFELSAAEITAMGAPAGDTNAADTEITDFYGYAIDMIFRTNATESNLLLRTDAIDRVYSDNTANVETMGGGSTMSFSSGDANFSVDKVAELMKALRVVFLDKDGNILAHARPDMGSTGEGESNTPNYSIAGSEVTADLLIYNEEVTSEEVEATVVTDATAAWADTYKKTTTTGSDGKITTVTYKGTKNEGAETYTVKSYTTVTTPGSFEAKNKGIITPLTQNEPMQVTVIVYLDGNAVDNSMVATAGKSMTGSLNLQFASDADLVPMDNTALKEGSGNAAAATPTPAP